jgi:hypothetical protein
MGFDLADMRLYAAATRFTLGRLRGGDEGRSLGRQAGAAMTGEGVRDPERFAAMLVPGFSRDV